MQALWELVGRAGLGWALPSAGGAQCCTLWCDTLGGMGFFCTFPSTA